MGHTIGRGLWNARPPVNIKGIKKKGSAPLEWHSPLHPIKGSGNPELLDSEGTKRKCDPSSAS